MRIAKKNARVIATSSTAHPVSAAYADQWQYVQTYLKNSDGRAPQETLDAAVSVLPPELITASYVDLIRTTFVLKINPALRLVEPSAANFAGICENLKDGLMRYETCFNRLHIDSIEIRRAFQALVRSQMDSSSWRQSIHDWLLETTSTKAEDNLVKLHNIVEAIGLAHIVEEEFRCVLNEILATRLRLDIAGNWEESHLDSVIQSSVDESRRSLALLKLIVPDEQLGQLARDGLAELRTSELFDIVVDFPNSTAAIEDLKHCLDSTSMRANVVTSYQRDCQLRLLHPGANTPDIITIYISTIKVFLLLDPRGVLLDKVARPIRKYLRERTDTIRSIMSSLLGEVDNELAQELARHDYDGPEIEDGDDPNWMPDPIDAAPDYIKRKASDIIGSLISIYENKDVFVRELQTLLADRLLAITDYNIDQELHNLEMLKVRFGEGMMSVCDVMLKDMTDSRRIDAKVHAPKHELPEHVKPENVIHTTILSRLYWPAISKSQAISANSDSQGHGLRLPHVLDGMLQEYSAEFTKLKAQRSLHFQKELGHVRVELSLNDRHFDMLVTPSHAATIHLFNSDEDREVRMTLAEVAEGLGLSTQEARRNLGFWISQKILAIVSDGTENLFTVLESLPSGGLQEFGIVAPLLPELGPDDPSAEAQPLQDDEDDSTFWQFIVGMLTNIGALPAERIQSMLGMFAPNYDQTLEQLKALLTRKLRSGEVELKGGVYKLAAQ